MITYSRLRRRSGGQAGLAAGVGQTFGEPRAGVDLDQHRRDRHAGQHRGELVAQRAGLGGDVLGGQRRDDQLPVGAEADLALPAAPGELGLQVRQRPVQLVIRQCQGVGRGRRLAHQVAVLQPLRLPLPRGQQERGRVSVPARPRDVDVARAQAVAQGHQHAQLPVVPVGDDVAVLRRLLQVPGPPGGHEAARCPVRDLAGPGRVQPSQDAGRLQQVVHAGAAGEADGGQHVGDELAQVGHRGVHQRQVPVVAGQPLAPGLVRRPHPLVADVPPQPPAHLVVGHVRVEHDRQDVIQQGLPVLAAPCALGEHLCQPLPRGRLPAGQRLVEQQQHLVQHVHGGLRGQGQQDGVLAVSVTAGQVLRRQPAPQARQEPAPLGRQDRQVQRVRVHPAQVRQLLQLALHRRRRR